MTLAEFHRIQKSAQAIVLPAGSVALTARPVSPAALARMAVRRGDAVFKSPKVAGALIAFRKAAKR
jgi:hypothetical protein